MKARLFWGFFFVTFFAVASCGGGGGGTGQGGGGTQPSTPSIGNTRLSAGWHHTCYVKDDSTVWCWGSNSYGELGNGTTTDSSTPVQVVLSSQGDPLTGAVAVSASRYYTCALLSDGTVKCWGWNEGGKLGDGKVDSNPFPFNPYPDETYSPYPVDVIESNNQKLTDVVAISAGSWHACALLSDGTVKCWGQNFDGALGIGKDPNNFDPFNPDWDTLFSPYPLTVVDGVGSQTPLQNVIQVSAGSSDHTCALIDDDGDNKGYIRCWAWNGGTEGQLGNGNTTDTYVTAPSDPVKDGFGNVITNAVQIAAGGDFTCALLDDSTVVCWGWNQMGQVGDDNAGTDAPMAHVVVDEFGNPITGIEKIFTERGNHACALKTDGTLVCWGDNAHGQLGFDPTQYSYISHAVSLKSVTNVLTLGVGGGGRDPLNNAVVQYDGDHTCAEVSTQTGTELWCWGSNDRGQLGDGTTNDSYTPVQVQGL